MQFRSVYLEEARRTCNSIVSYSVNGVDRFGRIRLIYQSKGVFTLLVSRFRIASCLRNLKEGCTKSDLIDLLSEVDKSKIVVVYVNESDIYDHVTINANISHYVLLTFDSVKFLVRSCMLKACV